MILRTGGQDTPDFYLAFTNEQDKSQFETLLNQGLDLAVKLQDNLESYAATLGPDPATPSHTGDDSGEAQPLVGYLRYIISCP